MSVIDLKFQLEEALQMLRLVSENKRTSVEVQEWLNQNYPEEPNEIVELLMANVRTQ